MRDFRGERVLAVGLFMINPLERVLRNQADYFNISEFL